MNTTQENKYSVYFERFMSGESLEDNLPGMRINEIAYVISQDWVTINYAARPYVMAMYSLQYMDEFYLHDSAKSIINYFLSNAYTWRGSIAKSVKNELKNRVKRVK